MIRLGGEPLRSDGFSRLQNILLLDEVDSTNTFAAGLADYALREEFTLRPSAVAALVQTAGRGRRERVWNSPPGGLYVTFLCEAPEGVPISLWPLAAALWTADAAQALGVHARLKWPNDLLCGDKKLAGILTEARTRGDSTQIAVGIGINFFGTAQRYLEARATTVEAESGVRPRMAFYFHELCARFDEFLVAPAPENIVGRWLDRSVHRPGSPMSVEIEERGAAARLGGTFEGLTAEGLLRIRTDAGVREVACGEVEIE